MKYNVDEIKDACNYYKIGSIEELFDSESSKDISEKRGLLKKRIEPWLSAALQSEHMNLLIGSGLTNAVCSVAGVKPSSMGKAEFGEFNEKINNYAKREAEEINRGEGNIEDQIRTALSLLRGYEIDNNIEKGNSLKKQINQVLQDFAESILESETNFVNKIKEVETKEIKEAEIKENKKIESKEKVSEALSLLKSFLFTFASRNSTRDRTHIFTTNYDRFIEYGCDTAGIKVLDRFFGKIVPRFEENTSSIDYYYHTSDIKNEFRYVEGVVRFTKLHGSIDWYERDGNVYRDALRFGAEKVELPDGLTYRDNLMIFPNSMKSVETAFYPYAELFRDFSTAICRPHTTLFTYGYGFGDTHINKIIKEMLNTPSTHLIISVHSFDEKIINFLRTVNMAQVSILFGPEFNDLKNLVNFYLPKASIDNITFTASKLIENRKGYLDNSLSDSGVDKDEEDF